MAILPRKLAVLSRAKWYETVNVLLQSLYKHSDMITVANGVMCLNGEREKTLSIALEILATNDQISEKFLLKYVFQINAISIRAINAAQISTNGIA